MPFSYYLVKSLSHSAIKNKLAAHPIRLEKELAAHPIWHSPRKATARANVPVVPKCPRTTVRSLGKCGGALFVGG